MTLAAVSHRYSRAALVDASAPGGTQNYVLAQPRSGRGRAARRLIVDCHANNENGLTDWAGGFTEPVSQFFDALISGGTGCSMVSHDLGYLLNSAVDDSNQGNDAAMAIIENLRTTIAPAAGAKSDKLIVLGRSMGGGTAVRYAVQHTTKVAALVLMWPALDIETYRWSDANSVPAENYANDAWGLPDGSYLGNTTSGLNVAMPSRVNDLGHTVPMDLMQPAAVAEVAALTAAGVPVLFFYSTADAIVTAGRWNGSTQGAGSYVPGTWCPAAGVSPTVVSTTLAHGDPGYYSALPLSTILATIDAAAG